MSLTDRQLIQIASTIREQLLELHADKHGQIQHRLESLIEQTGRIQVIHKKLGICKERSWHAAAEKLKPGIEAVLRELPFHSEQISRALQDQVKLPSLRDVYEELLAIEDEFGELIFHDQSSLLAVVTEPIELDGMFLGDFEIQLHVPSLERVRNREIYRIYALDPHPATCNSSVTHPHVSDERLCAGDANAAIKAALASGRICDFFTLVRSVLTTYNPESPYVKLEDWDGTSCYECGYSVPADNTCWCDNCQHEYCDECSSYCATCDCTTCNSCLQSCHACEDSNCPNCLFSCPDCGARLCRSCLDNNECPCHEENEDEAEQEATRQTADIDAA